MVSSIAAKKSDLKRHQLCSKDNKEIIWSPFSRRELRSVPSSVPEENNSSSQNEINKQTSPLHLIKSSFSRLSSPEFPYRTIDETTIEIISKSKTICESSVRDSNDSDDSIEDIYNNFITSPT
ncbi:hypothetical protein ACI65C_006758 [Semiaphis heraclei]